LDSGHQMTEKSAEMVPDLVVRRGPMGRSTYSREAKRQLAQLCAQPGVSVARLALTHGVNANLLRKWMHQYGQVRSTPSGAKSAASHTTVLLPIEVASEVKSRREVRPSRASRSSGRRRRYACAVRLIVGRWVWCSTAWRSARDLAAGGNAGVARRGRDRYAPWHAGTSGDGADDTGGRSLCRPRVRLSRTSR